MSGPPIIIAARVHCKDCQIERLHPFDKGGITHEQLYLRKRYIKCDECNKSHSLEFYPVFQGQNLLDVTNTIIKENDLKVKKLTGSKAENKQQPEPIQKIESTEEWQSRLWEKYVHLKQVCNDNLPGLWDSLEFELSVQKILNIKDCTLPFAGIVLGRPSSLKTVGIDLFRKWPNTYYTDNFSVKAFVSHSTAVKREVLEKIDMLPKIKNHLFLTPELSPTFSKKDDDLIDVLGILTRVLDGHGYESDTGAHGHRSYNEPMMFTWVGAAVDIPYKVHKYLGTLGPKLYFLRLPNNRRSEDEYLDEIDKKFEEKKNRVQVALFDYLNLFERCPNLHIDSKSKLQKIEWDFQKNEKLAKQYIVKLGMLLAHLRGVVPTWHTEDTDGLGYGYALATIEEPDRAITQLMNLARGHALSRGRNHVTLLDIPIVIKVVFSTASLERVRIFELLLEYGGKLSTSMITNSLKIAENTAKRVMAEFRAIGLVDIEDVKGGTGSPEKRMVLEGDFEWFLSDEFTSVRNLPPYSYHWTRHGLGGHFSDTYSKTVLLNSVLPRT